MAKRGPQQTNSEDPARDTAQTGSASDANSDSGPRSGKEVKLPGTSVGTNLMVADILVRGASRLLRGDIKRRIDRNSEPQEDGESDKLNGRAILTTLGLYGASKLANRSPRGLAIVTGGLLAKSLYDRGKSRQLRKRREARDAIAAEDKPETGET